MIKDPYFKYTKNSYISIIKIYLKDIDTSPNVGEVGASPVGVRQADFQHLTELENCNSNNKETSLTTMMAKVRKTDNT